MLQIAKQANEITRKHGALRVEYFQLSNTENMMDYWTNIAKIVSANQDDEKVWVEQIFCKNSKHRDEYIAKCGNAENMNRLYKQFMDLITPESIPIMEEFGRLRV
jgi:ssDNA-specific exonuclease RecJ